MSDDFASSAALGYLAARVGGAQTMEAVHSLFNGMRERAAAVDVNALLQALQEQDHLINQQSAYIAGLQKNLADWKEYGAEVEIRRAKLEEYSIWAEAELKKRSQND